VFTVPGAWVRHVEGHALDAPHARKRKSRSASDDTEETMALLRCDLCQKHFPNPGEWNWPCQTTVRHQNVTIVSQRVSKARRARTAGSERPFICGMCNKGFNVKSNLLRHLRTLHDQIISPALLDTDEEAPHPSEVKRET
ncbi:Uncharacterized protein OBRU01_19209, partial [Operophtera brumata]